MPLKSISAEQALSNLRSNKTAQWGGGQALGEAGFDVDHAASRLHLPQISLKMATAAKRLKRGSSIFAMGSCFARVIESHLSQHGFKILSRPEGEKTIIGKDGDEYAEYGLMNRYNVPSMLLEFKRLLDGPHHVPDEAMLIDMKGGTYADGHYFIVGPTTRDEIIDRRRRFYENFQALKTADVVILTLGLNEAGYDLEWQLYRNTSPTVRELRMRRPVELRWLTVAENVACLQEIYELLQSRTERMPQLFVTVSPIPLSVTYSEEDVIIANSAAKATLRAAAYEFCATRPDVIYFPSYEMAMNAAQAAVFNPDKRHIQRRFVGHIVQKFCEQYLDD